MILTEGQKNVIIYMNSLGFPVLQILERFYSVQSFEEGGTNLPKHSLVGKDITSFMVLYQDIHALDESKRDEIYRKITELKTTNKYFHKDILWVLHLN